MATPSAGDFEWEDHPPARPLRYGDIVKSSGLDFAIFLFVGERAFLRVDNFLRLDGGNFDISDYAESHMRLLKEEE
jgi:hypothetical protein